MILFEGASRIDGAPIVVLATGVTRPSANAKTGPMVQTYILRADQAPLAALASGADRSVCGGCQLRGLGGEPRVCYVNVGRDPTVVWNAWKAGRYAKAGNLTELGAGRYVRLGAYGDPAAVPLTVWDQLLAQSAGWTGYSHQWRSARLRDVMRYCQASCDSAADRDLARSYGLSTFRVLDPTEQSDSTEQVCPYEQHGTQCVECRACSGANAPDIVVQVHGRRAGSFTLLSRRARV